MVEPGAVPLRDAEAPHEVAASSQAPINTVVASPLSVSKDRDNAKLAPGESVNTPAATRGDRG
jgi:hypothetical protein